MRISDWSSDVCSSDLWCWARPRTTDALTGCRTSRPRGFPGPLCMGLRPGVPPIMAAVQPVYDDPFSGPDMTAPVRLIVGLGNPGPEYDKIGRASCREGEGQYVEISVVVVSVKK